MGVAHRRQPVGDHDGGAVGRHLGQGALDGGLGLVVDRRGGLVEDQDGGVAQDGPGDGEPLALATRQLLAPLAHQGLVAQRQRLDELGGLGQLCGASHLLIGGLGAAVGEVLAHGAVEQEHVLGHQPGGAPQRGEGEVRDGLAVQRDAAGRRFVQPQQQLDHGGLARSGGPDDGVGLTGGHVDGDVSQHVGVVGGGPVGERHVVEADRAPDRLGQVVGAGQDAGLGAQQPEDPTARRHGPLVLVEGLAERGERPEQPLGHVHEHREHADRQLAPEGGPAADDQRHGEAGQDGHADQRVEGG